MLTVTLDRKFGWPALASTRVETSMIGQQWLHKRPRLIPTFVARIDACWNAFFAALRHRSCRKAVLILDGIDKFNPHIRSSFHTYLYSELDSDDWSTWGPFFMYEVCLPSCIPIAQTCWPGRGSKLFLNAGCSSHCRNLPLLAFKLRRLVDISSI
jgi:hypothetical protein